MSEFLLFETFSQNDSTQCPPGPNSTAAYPVPNPYIPSWPIQAVYIVAYASMVVVAAGGNVIIVWIVMAHKRMRTVTNYFLVNLAVADALNSVLNTLFSFVYMLYNDWVFGRGYCKFTQFIVNCTISASVFTFMAIAMDRYNAIIHPLKPRMGSVCVVCVICVVWASSAAVALPSLVFAETYAYPGTGHVVCYLEWPDGTLGTSDLVYNIFLLVVNYFAPLSALTVTYSVVGWHLWGSQAIGERTPGQEETIRSKRRVVKMLIVVVVIFGVCWLPMHLYFIVGNFFPVLSLPGAQHVYLVIYWIAMSNSMYNPIMYCWMNVPERVQVRLPFPSVRRVGVQRRPRHRRLPARPPQSVGGRGSRGLDPLPPGTRQPLLRPSDNDRRVLPVGGGSRLLLLGGGRRGVPEVLPQPFQEVGGGGGGWRSPPPAVEQFPRPPRRQRRRLLSPPRTLPTTTTFSELLNLTRSLCLSLSLCLCLSVSVSVSSVVLTAQPMTSTPVVNDRRVVMTT